MENPEKHHWSRGLRPLLWWLLLVLVLLAIRTHERLSEQTHLSFATVLQGRSVAYEVTATVDKQSIESGNRISIGRHQFSIMHPKAETFSTNLFIWYGEHDLGQIVLKRGQGTLAVKANPPAGLIDIRGPEFSLKLTNSTGITVTVPTDTYTVNAHYLHWRQGQEISVSSTFPGTANFSPRLGTAQLTCNQSNASFQILTGREQLVEAGEFPATIEEMPEGIYKLLSSHHGNQIEQALAVKAGGTNSSEIQFRYGKAILETVPPGATVYGVNGRELGITPLRIDEILAGQWQFQFRLNGYEPVSSSLDIAAQTTAALRTNLVNISYVRALNSARQFLAAMDYDRALGAVADALQVNPNDSDALSVQREARGKRSLSQARSFGKQDDFIAGVKELELALQSLPDNEEAKQLLVDFKKREPEQIERLRVERLERPKKVFDALLSKTRDAELFESHELKSSKPVEQVQSAIVRQLMNVQPPFQITKNVSTAPETFEIEATQEFMTVLATPSGRRQCLIVVGQTRDEETQIFFKVLEYKTEAVNKFSIGALINAPVEVNYVPIHSSRIGKMTEKLQAQVTNGVPLVTECVQRAGGQSPNEK